MLFFFQVEYKFHKLFFHEVPFCFFTKILFSFFKINTYGWDLSNFKRFLSNLLRNKALLPSFACYIKGFACYNIRFYIRNFEE